ncbi:hypothetical protein RLIN73S_07459 [Rhodanobacter lindaniclasticus]
MREPPAVPHGRPDERSPHACSRFRRRVRPAHLARATGCSVQPRLRSAAGALAHAVASTRREQGGGAACRHRALRGQTPRPRRGQARDSPRRLAADQRARRGHRQADPSAPGGGDRRRDRLGQDNPATEAVPGRRSRRSRPDRLHPAAPARRALGGAPGGRGVGHAAGRGGGFPGALQRPGERAYPGQVHDRRHPARRDAGRSVAQRLRHADHRRGARAQPQHRLPARLSEAARREAAGAENHRHLGDDRHRALRRALRRCAGGRSGRARVSGGNALAAGGGRGQERATGQRRTHRRRARRDQP